MVRVRDEKPAATAGFSTPSGAVRAAHLDRVAVWVLRAGVVALPLAVWPPGYDIFVLPKLALLRLLVLTLAGLRVAAWAVVGRPAWRRTPLDLPLALFVASAALSAALAVNVGVAVFGTYYRYEGLLTIACYALLFWLAVQAIDRREARTLVRCLLLGGYVVALLAAVQWAIGGAAVGAGAGESESTFAGSLRAASTMGNANALGTFLALLLPLAARELLAARGAGERVLATNVAACLGLALVLTYSRAAWAGAALGVAIVAAGPAARAARRRPAAAAGVALAAAAGLGLAAATRAGPGWFGTALARAATLSDATGGSGATRLHIWHDSLPLIVARPWTGWGPDTFGLVFPRFATGDWTPGYSIDKAHNDLLQVAATQGLLGVAAQLWLLGAIVATFWRGRRRPGAVAFLAALVAYEVTLQTGFSWLPASAPASLLMATAIVAWRPDPAPAPAPAPGVRRAGVIAGLGAAAALLAAGLALATLPVAADTRFRSALAAQARDQHAVALRDLAAARRLAPEESVYAAETGDVLLDVDRTGAPGRAADPVAARAAYEDAVRLGDVRPEVRERLAVADRMAGH